jgi:hypothetical protein
MPCWTGYTRCRTANTAACVCGNASLYAVWFGMRPEQLPYATGDVVDTALNLSVYDAPRGAQLSGRIIDLHPAGLGSAMPQQAALVEAVRTARGIPAAEEAAREWNVVMQLLNEMARPAAGTRKICSPCARSWEKKIPAKRWWRSRHWNRWG